MLCGLMVRLSIQMCNEYLYFLDINLECHHLIEWVGNHKILPDRTLYKKKKFVFVRYLLPNFMSRIMSSLLPQYMLAS